MRKILAVLLLGAATGACAQGLEPGLWELTGTTTITGERQRTSAAQRCITKEDLQDPQKWLAQRLTMAECKYTWTKKSATGVSWQMSCPKNGIHGLGSARIGRGVMESEQRITSDKGGKFEIYMTTTGKRLGPCKS